VNPAGWAIEHFLRNHAVVVYLRYTRFGADALGLNLLELLRKTLPPEKLAIFLVDLDVEDVNADNYDTPVCSDSDSSSSGATCGSVDVISEVAATQDSLDSTNMIGGYVGDLDPFVFYPEACE